MKSFFFPAMVMLAGVAMVLDPLNALGNCGLNPIVYVPSKCNPPYTTPPLGNGGTCVRQSDGTCISYGCGGVQYENAMPGTCGPAVVTEGNVPRCEHNYAATAIQVNQYAWGCNSSCVCKPTATGQTATITVCTCRDLAPGT